MRQRIWSMERLLARRSEEATSRPDGIWHMIDRLRCILEEEEEISGNRFVVCGVGMGSMKYPLSRY